MISSPSFRELSARALRALLLCLGLASCKPNTAAENVLSKSSATDQDVLAEAQIDAALDAWLARLETEPPKCTNKQ